VPTLSIITVCKNAAQKIRTTADSIACQSSKDFEWVVVDGASSDNTLEELRSYENHITKLISESDNCLYDAMNKGILVSSGRYLYFLNAGDMLAEQNVINDFIQSPQKGDIIVGDILIKYVDGREQYRESKSLIFNKELLYWRPMHHQATIIKRELFEKYGMYNLNYQICADWEFFCRVILKYKTEVTSWHRFMSVFCNDGISADIRNRKIFKKERFRIRRRYYPLHYIMRREINERWGGIVHYFRIKKQNMGL